MNDNDQGTRSFGSEPEKAPRKGGNGNLPLKQYLLYAILAIAAVVGLLLCATVITEIVYSINTSKLPDNDIGGGKVDMVNGDMKFESSSLSSAEVKKGDLLLINKTHNIDATLKASIKAASKNTYTATGGSVYYKFDRTDDKIKLSDETIKAFGQLAEGLYNDKNVSDLLLCYGILDPNKKTLEYDYSHQLGTVVDVKLMKDGNKTTIQSNPEIAEWLKTNACKYGFIVEYEPVIDGAGNKSGHGSDEAIPSTQLRYVGVAHATYIQANNLTFEAYLAKVRTASSEKPLTFKAGESSYAVYFVEASGENFEASLPTNYNYSISGNNVDGIIVTVELSVKK